MAREIALIAACQPILVLGTEPGTRLEGDFSVMDDWAFFLGNTVDAMGRPVTPPDGVSSDAVILFREVYGEWRVIDHGLGISDAFYLGWARQHVAHSEPSDEDLRPAAPVEGFEITRVEPADAGLNRRYYERVGEDWNWKDRLPWSDMDWQAHVEREELSTWLATYEGEKVGYVELEQQPEGNLQISYFGLLPDQYGKGLGGAMLTAAVKTAWEMPGTRRRMISRRVWVHTCSEDHPAALANYLKRGFQVFRIENPAATD